MEKKRIKVTLKQRSGRSWNDLGSTTLSPGQATYAGTAAGPLQYPRGENVYPAHYLVHLQVSGQVTVRNLSPNSGYFGGSEELGGHGMQAFRQGGRIGNLTFPGGNQYALHFEWVR